MTCVQNRAKQAFSVIPEKEETRDSAPPGHARESGAEIGPAASADAAWFWSKVDKSEGCWEWAARRTKRGYGAVWVREKRRHGAAHRVAYELAVGPIPAGLFVCHHCDNPPCVRPDHLFVGTAMDNVRDMVAKGRGPGMSGRWIEPTGRQVDVLAFIAAGIRERGFAPTIREIGRGVGIASTNGVNDHLKALENKELLVRTPKASRSFVITEAGRRLLRETEAADK